MMARARLSAALALLAAPQVASAQPAPDPAPPTVAPAPPTVAPAPPTVAPAPPTVAPAPPTVAPAPPAAAPAPLTFVIAKLTTTIYGYLEGNFKYDSTQSCVEFCGSTQIQRSGTYRGDHGRTIFSARDSRLGLRLAAPESHGIRVSGVLETDFFGPTATTEQSTYVNPVLRIRTSFLKIETSVLDILVGQQWTLFGWQPSFISASVQYPGLPGETFERTPQLRLSKTIKSDAITTELAVAANRPPQQDSATPEGVAGIRLSFNHWTGQHTTYMANTAIQPASVGISGDVRGFRIPELAVAQHHGIPRTGGGVALDAYLPIIPATAASKDNALSLNGEVSITSGMSDAFTAVGAAGTANAVVPPATPGGAATPYAANFDPGLAAIDAAGHAELIKWIGYFASLEFYPTGTDGRVGLVANYGHMESSNAHSVGTASTAGSTAMAAAAAAARIRDHEDLFEVGGYVDPTRQTRIAASGSLYADGYGDGVTANNYALIVSGWLFF